MIKDLSLIFHIIRDFIIKEKLIALVFFVSAVLFGFSTIFVAGAFISYFSDKNSEDISDCRHVVSFRNPVNVDVISELSGSKGYTSRRYTELSSLITADSEAYKVLTFYGDDNTLLQYICHDGRLNFTQKELNQGERVAILSTDLSSAAGDFIKLPFWEGEFLVVGVVDDPMGKLIIIPFEYFEELNFPVKSLTFVTKSKLSLFEEKKLEYEMTSDGNAVFTGGITYREQVQNNTVDLFGCGIMLFITVILGFFLIKYATEKNSYTYSVLGISGAGKGTVLYILTLERIILTAVVMVAASVLHILLRDFLSSLLLLEKCEMNLGDYGIILAVTVLISVFSAVPYAIGFVKKSYALTIKHYE